jgi:hypothetical protein
MDNKQAISELKCLREDYWDDDGYGHETKEYEDTMVALDKAIASLEAWEKINEELEKEMNEYENVLSDLSYSDGVGYALAVIDEHLKEIEE